ncbi:MAG: HU family DNA-binding protein [Prevotella sp.]
MEKLTINHIASILVEKNGVDPKDAEQFVAAMFDVIQEGLEKDKLVKVRGLGTFKIVDVEPRESVNVNTGERVLIKGHSKISFTPDSSMKETVNKPFSQFETVVLNEGVEFTETATETEPAEPVEQAVNADDTVEEPVVAETSAGEQEAAEDNAVEESAEAASDVAAQKEPVIAPVAEETVLEAQKEPENMDKEDTVSHQVEEEPIEESVHGRKVSGVFWWVLLVLVLLGGSGYFGYWLASSGQSASVSDVEMTQSESLPAKASPKKAAADKPVFPTPVAVEQNVKDAVKASHPVQPAAAAPVKASQPETDIQKMAAKYDALDTRVRTGAYCIVGEETTVKVKGGETMKIISKRALGPGMECYIEVFNNLPANAELKEGQTIRIPKLELRKRVFKKAQ